MYAAYLSQMQRHEQATAEAKRAKELDPLSPSVNISFFYTLWSARQYDQAMEIAKQMLELDLNVPLAHLLFGYTYAAKGQYQEAIAAYKEAMKLGTDTTTVRIHLGYAYAMAGKREQAQANTQRVAAGLRSMSRLPNNSLCQSWRERAGISGARTGLLSARPFS